MSNLEILAKLAGISSEYTDKVGQIHYTTDDVRKCFLTDMGYPCGTDSEIESSIKKLENNPWQKGLDAVSSFFTDESDTAVSLRLRKIDLSFTASFDLEDEDGKIIHGQIKLKDCPIKEYKIIEGEEYVLLRPVLFKKINPGYYRLTVCVGEKKYQAMIIMALPKCYLADGIAEETFRIYGLAVQLYALRSKNNMGIGDFTDLKNIIRLTAANGGDVVGVNPLGAMFPESRKDVSPYRSLSRQYLNYAYLDLTAVPEFQDSEEIQKLLESEEYQRELKRLRNVDMVDYYHVFKFKLRLLKIMFKYFSYLHLEHPAGVTERGKEFLAFIKSKGEKFHNICLFEALLERHSIDGTYNDWRYWPYNYDKINSFHTRDFANIHKKELDFYAYCHWLAEGQLAEAAELCHELGMKVGLYLDSPIGAASSGVEVWENREVFAENMGVGAPADPMRPRGQSWGFAPYHPLKLKEAYYEPFIKLIRENMLYAKALRIDHAMGLMRLFWVYFIKGNPVVQGAYVYYTMKDMVAILSIESHRSKCMVIGEDLGTVPPGFREYMFEHGLLSNKVFFRQKDKDGTYLAPEHYQYLSLAQASTHDQATAYGYWLDEDIKTFKDCNLYVNEEQFLSNLATRASERALLIKAFSEQDTFYDKQCLEDAKAKLDGKKVPSKLEYAVNKYVARCQSAVFLQRIEDIYGQVVMENVPGTTYEYPNWRHKLTIDIEDMAKDGRFKRMFDMIRSERC